MPCPEDFNLGATLDSHGWMRLAPFQTEGGRLLAVLPGGGRLWRVEVEQGPKGLRVQAGPGRPGKAARAELAARLGRCLALHWDLRPFHRRLERCPRLRWIARRGLGRITRAGDMFEDLAKLILTTNCTWSQTVGACRRLVQTLGPAGPEGLRGFPSPAEVLAAGPQGLAALGLGYRVRALLELAERAGELAAWERLPAPELRRHLLGLRGVGPYVADHMGLMLGHSERIPLDSWLRARASRLLFSGRPATAAGVAEYYRPFGPWAGRVAWFDLNREFFQEGRPVGATG